MWIRKKEEIASTRATNGNVFDILETERRPVCLKQNEQRKKWSKWDYRGR